MAERFQVPEAKEVTDYAKTLSFRLDGQVFCDYYESKGWRIGNSPMKNWKAAVRTWKNRQGGGIIGNQNSSGGGYQQTKQPII